MIGVRGDGLTTSVLHDPGAPSAPPPPQPTRAALAITEAATVFLPNSITFCTHLRAASCTFLYPHCTVSIIPERADHFFGTFQSLILYNFRNKQLYFILS